VSRTHVSHPCFIPSLKKTIKREGEREREGRERERERQGPTEMLDVHMAVRKVPGSTRKVPGSTRKNLNDEKFQVVHVFQTGIA